MTVDAMSELTVQTAPEILLPSGDYQVETARLRTENKRILALASHIVSITNEDEHEKAVAVGRLVQAVSKQLAEHYKPYKSKVDAVKKVILEDERKDTEEASKEKARLGALVLDWDRDQEKKRQEQMRVDRERAQREEEERRLADAIYLEQQGQSEEAEAVLNESAMPIPVITQKVNASRLPGQVVRTKYRGKVVGFHSLVKAVAEGKVPILALEVNQSFVNTQANQFREALDWPGVVVEIEVSSHFRS